MLLRVDTILCCVVRACAPTIFPICNFNSFRPRPVILGSREFQLTIHFQLRKNENKFRAKIENWKFNYALMLVHKNNEREKKKNKKRSTPSRRVFSEFELISVFGDETNEKLCLITIPSEIFFKIRTRDDTEHRMFLFFLMRLLDDTYLFYK